jgi:hypothetical protein
MAQSESTSSLSAEDIKLMLDMAKDAVHNFAGHRHEAGCAFFTEPNVDWQLSLSEVPATLASQPDIKHCNANDAIFFMRMNELTNGERTLGGRVFLGPIMATKTGIHTFPYVLNTWDAMPPHWMSRSASAASSSAASSSAVDKETEKLITYFERCIDMSSMKHECDDMPGLEEDLELPHHDAMNTATREDNESDSD